MSKKIKMEDGKIYKEHKPFYKRWWFIVIAIILAFGLIGSIFGEDEEPELAQEPATEEKEEISAPITEETEEPEDEKIEDPVEEEPEPKESDNYGNKDYYVDASVTYDQLARTPDDFEDSKAVFTGTVLQVMDGEYSYNTIRLAVDDNYDNVIMIDYSKDIMQERLLEDDKITVYGISRGLITYTSTFKQEISIPHMDAYIIERIQ